MQRLIVKPRTPPASNIAPHVRTFSSPTKAVRRILRPIWIPGLAKRGKQSRYPIKQVCVVKSRGQISAIGQRLCVPREQTALMAIPIEGQNIRKVLANGAPPTHGARRTFTGASVTPPSWRMNINADAIRIWVAVSAAAPGAKMRAIGTHFLPSAAIGCCDQRLPASATWAGAASLRTCLSGAGLGTGFG